MSLNRDLKQKNAILQKKKKKKDEEMKNVLKKRSTQRAIAAHNHVKTSHFFLNL